MRRTRPRGGHPLLLVALAATGALAHATARAADPPSPETVEALKARLADLEKRLEAIETTTKKAELDAELQSLKKDAGAEARAGEAESGTAQGAGAGLQRLLNAMNPQITAFGDFVAPIELTGNAGPTDDRFSLREAELDLRAAIDPYASAVLILSVGETTPGAYEVDIEEGYLTLDSLPWGFRMKIGRFLTRIGSINSLHTHDLPWSNRPYATQDLIGGDEGWKENGAALSWLAPALGPMSLSLTGWVLDGENPVVLAGSDSGDPAYMGRIEAFWDLGGGAFLTLGANLLFGYADPEGREEATLGSQDLLLSYRPNQRASAVVLGEVYELRQEVPGGREHGLGAFGALQVQPNLAALWAPLEQTYFGVRYDVSDYDEQTAGADQWAVGGYVSFYTTEFLRFRLGYEHRERSTRRLGRPDERKLTFQLTMVFGSHPAEPFWVNR